MKLLLQRITILVLGGVVTAAGCGGCGQPVDFRVTYPDRDSIGDDDPLGVVWEEVEGNPLLPLGDCPTWHCLGQTDPWVEPKSEGGWTIWFSAGGDHEGPVVGRGDLTGDLELNLRPVDKPVLSSRYQASGAWDLFRETVSLRWDEEGERWIKWYLGYSISFFDDPGFGQMYSKDQEGIEWEPSLEPIYRPQPGAWDHAFITGPTFIETPGGQWRLYYSGAGTTIGIGVLLSDDRGQTWEAYEGNPVFERDLDSWDQGLFEPGIRHYDGRYMMWYSGYEEPLDMEKTPIYIGLATSEDGLNWERSPHNPVTGPAAPGTWNDFRLVSPTVVFDDDGSLLMFIHGQSQGLVGRSMGQLGVLRSRP